MLKLATTISMFLLLGLGFAAAVILTPTAAAVRPPCPGNSCHGSTTTAGTTTTTTTTTDTTPTTTTTTTTTPTTTATTVTTTTTATTTTTPTVTPPASSIYWGAYMDGSDTYSYLYGGSWGDAPWDANTWQRFQSNAAKSVSIVHWGIGTPWAHDFTYWQGTFGSVQNAGALNLVDMGTGSVALRDIAAGAYDTSLRTWAQGARAWGHPFFLRLDWEMNGSWFSWGTTSSNQNTPSDYVAAWRHVHDIFDASGASNVTWVWCPNLEFSGSVPYSQLYPGDSYVDWTCLDGYNKGGGSTSFASLYGQSYSDLLMVAPTTPIMIGEIGSLEFGAGVKAAWITDMLQTQLPQNFPQVKALVWFNWRIYESGSWSSWEIESSGSSQAAFSAAIGSPYYAGASDSLSALPLLSKINPL